MRSASGNRIHSFEQFERLYSRMILCDALLLLKLEMIRGGPSTLGGRRNELFAGHLMGTDSAGGTLWNVRTREKLKVK